MGEVTMSWSAKQALELFGTESSIRGDRSHGVGVDRVVAGDGQPHVSVGHCYVFALAQYHEPGSSERTDRLIRADAGDLWHEARP